MTKNYFLVAMILMGCIVPIVCFLGYFGVIQNGVIISRIIKVLLICILAIWAIYAFKFRNFDRMTLVAMVVATACVFILVAR